MSYVYEHPHPALATDIALFSAVDGQLSLLLIRRGHPPFQDHWAFPGGFMEIGETLANCAGRELEEETGLAQLRLDPVALFDAPDRDPRERVVTLVHAGAVRAEEVRPAAGSDAGDVRWFSLGDLPALAFDHERIVVRLADWLADHPDPMGLALRMLPRDFTPRDLVRLYQQITGQNR